VRSEATIGDRYGALAPVMIEPCERPVAFELIQSSDLTEWSGDQTNPRWKDFIRDITAKLADRRRSAKTMEARPPDSAAIEAIFWQSIKDSSEPGDFRSYLSRYPNGHFTDIARNRLSALQPKATPSRVPLVVGLAVLVLAGAVGGYYLLDPASVQRLLGIVPAEDAAASAAGPAVDPAAPSSAAAPAQSPLSEAAKSISGRWRMSWDVCENALSFEPGETVLQISRPPDFSQTQSITSFLDGWVLTTGLTPEASKGQTFSYRREGDLMIYREGTTGRTETLSKCG
jgi:hypothetical protein